MKEQKKVNPLATESEGKLIAKFAIPAIISMLVSSLYNIVDQIFIGQGVGLLGNAATNIAFPVSIICTATALLLGIGSASNFNLCSGAGDHEKASRIAGTGLSMLVICGVIIAAVVLVFLDPLLHLFGVTTKILPYAQDYTGITAFGIPFLILTTGGNHLIRADQMIPSGCQNQERNSKCRNSCIILCIWQDLCRHTEKMQQRIQEHQYHCCNDHTTDYQHGKPGPRNPACFLMISRSGTQIKIRRTSDSKKKCCCRTDDRHRKCNISRCISQKSDSLSDKDLIYNII